MSPPALALTARCMQNRVWLWGPPHLVLLRGSPLHQAEGTSTPERKASSILAHFAMCELMSRWAAASTVRIIIRLPHTATTGSCPMVGADFASYAMNICAAWQEKDLKDVALLTCNTASNRLFFIGKSY